MAETPESSYTSLTITMISPEVLTVSYDDPIIESISVGDDGNTITVFYPSTYIGPVGKADEQIVSKALTAPDIVNKFTDYTESRNYINGNGTFVEYVNVFWDTVENATGYQVFIVIDQSAAVLFDTLGTAPLLNYKGFTPLFSDQSGILDAGTTNFQFYFKGTLEVSKLHAMVFTYTSELIGQYPINMITCVPALNKMFVEKTSYFLGDDKYITVKDDSLHLPGREINLLEKNIVAI